MCRNIKTLVHVEPLASGLEIREAALRFARKVSGFNGPSKANEAAFDHAAQEVAASARRLTRPLTTSAEPRNRQVEAAKAKLRSAQRFGAPRASGPLA